MELKKIIGTDTTAHIYAHSVEETCLEQIKRMVNNEMFTEPIVIMPDCHAGTGSTIGFTMLMGDKLSPNIVGVDIGCGVLAINMGNNPGVRQVVGQAGLDEEIRRRVPMGFSVRTTPSVQVTGVAREQMDRLCDRVGANSNRVELSIGTLGGGNHFIEFAESEKDGSIWLIIHSGSRNLGKRICDYWQSLANRGGQQTQSCTQRDKDNSLAYLEDHALSRYMLDMRMAQTYARANRWAIAGEVRNCLPEPMAVDIVESVHNYIDSENMIRKGAISSRLGEMNVIPLNMRDGTLLVRGKGNPAWNFSAPHGAGRVLSRRAAKKELKLDEFQETMQGVFSTSVTESTIDEAPMAYKDARMIEKLLEPTAEVIDHLRPLHNLKADG